MKEKSGKWRRAMLVLLFTVVATASLAGTATAVTHTEVESVTRYAPAGPAPDAEFEVTLRITGELPLVVGIVETIPEGFSFVSTTHPYYSVSGQKVAFAVINETEIKYTVKAPSSGEGTFSGEWVDLLVQSPELEEGKERWKTIPDTIVIVGGGGAGAIEGEVTPTPTPYVPRVTEATRKIPFMEAGKDVTMVFKDMDVSMITLKADKDVNDAELRVSRGERTPDMPVPPGIVYNYLDISVKGAGGVKIEGKVEFKVAKSWIDEKNIDETTVTLWRYVASEGKWQALTTTKVGEDDTTVLFSADTPGFSIFAVTGRERTEVGATPTPAMTPTATTPTAESTPVTTPTPASKVPGFGVSFAVVALIIIYLTAFRKEKRG